MRQATTELLKVLPKRVVVGVWALSIAATVLLVAIKAPDGVVALVGAGVAGTVVSLVATAAMRRSLDEEVGTLLRSLDERSVELRADSLAAARGAWAARAAAIREGWETVTSAKSEREPVASAAQRRHHAVLVLRELIESQHADAPAIDRAVVYAEMIGALSDRETAAVLDLIAHTPPLEAIVFIDGTANEGDAVALGEVFGSAGAKVSLAYVRNSQEPDIERQTLIERSAELLGDALERFYSIANQAPADELMALAEREEASIIVFSSDPFTAVGHVSASDSVTRLLERGSTAIAIAPVGLAERVARAGIRRIVAVSDADGGARETAEALANALGATVEPVVSDETDLLVLDSQAGTDPGRVSLRSPASYLIEIATCPVLVLPREVVLPFGGRAIAAGERSQGTRNDPSS